jgi:hypothetical protein
VSPQRQSPHSISKQGATPCVGRPQTQHAASTLCLCSCVLTPPTEQATCADTRGSSSPPRVLRLLLAQSQQQGPQAGTPQAPASWPSALLPVPAVGRSAASGGSRTFLGRLLVFSSVPFHRRRASTTSRAGAPTEKPAAATRAPAIATTGGMGLREGHSSAHTATWRGATRRATLAKC